MCNVCSEPQKATDDRGEGENSFGERSDDGGVVEKKLMKAFHERKVPKKASSKELKNYSSSQQR